MSISLPTLAHNKVVDIPTFEDDTPTPPAATSKRVFQTSNSFHGDLGDPSGADAKCQTDADADNSMVKNKTFKARLSGELSLGFAGLEGREMIKHDLPYYILAESTDASGRIQEPNNIWTGILSNGDFSDANCNHWTSSDRNVSGSFGTNQNSNSGWTEFTVFIESQVCSAFMPLYCIEQ